MYPEGPSVLQTLCECVVSARQKGATFLCVVVDCQQVIEGLPLKLIDMLRAVSGNIDAKFFHHNNRFCPDEITNEDVVAFQDSLVRRVAAKTANYYLEALKMLFESARRESRH